MAKLILIYAYLDSFSTVDHRDCELTYLRRWDRLSRLRPVDRFYSFKEFRVYDCMFHSIKQEISNRMRYLESIDTSERQKGLPVSERLCAISPEIGRFIAFLAATVPPGAWIEVGTSGGYSTLWLALACQERGKRIKTFELQEKKAQRARETFKTAGVESLIEMVVGDAKEYLRDEKNVSFCFLDADKQEYGDYYEHVVPNMVRGGILVCDNMISHQAILGPFCQKVLTDERVDAVLLPIGKGELVCRKL